ncbi:MAG TPA: hypothetical protein VGD67_22185, partial [Pseudonocardiaceae bacterium]
MTATSFAPVIAALDATLRGSDPCARFEVTVADGRGAAERVLEAGAHLWIPDDGSWAGVGAVRDLGLVAPGTVVATSPVYLVTDPGTADQLGAVGGGWLGLAGLVTSGRVRMVVRDPGGSGDGLVAAGAVGEAVWLDAGMDASAEALAAALPHTRTVTGRDAALPDAIGEVGLVPGHALPDGVPDGLRALAPADHTALLRYTWLQTQRAAGDPAVAAAIYRALQVFTGPDAVAALAAAHLGLPSGASAAQVLAAGGQAPTTPTSPLDPAAPTGSTDPGPAGGPGTP